jgi:phage repressor protein C with HTH and peptisase S24 domain
MLNKIMIAFGINKDWLLTGKGSMLKSAKPQYSIIYNTRPMIEIDKFIEYLKKNKVHGATQSAVGDAFGVKQAYLSLIIKGSRPYPDNYEELLRKRYSNDIVDGFINEQNNIQSHSAIVSDETAAKSICLYDVSASAGYGNFDEMISQEKVLGKYIVPDFEAADWMIYVKGSSMYPKYSSGDIVACRVLKESRFIQWGKVYVVATTEQGVLVKRLKESEKEDCIKAVSDNPSYDSFDIPKDEIIGIALVIGVIRME